MFTFVLLTQVLMVYSLQTCEVSHPKYLKVITNEVNQVYTTTNMDIKYKKYPEKITVHIAKRGRKMRIRYGSIWGEGEFKSEEKSIPLSLEEIKTWYREKKCPIGLECKFGGSCTGKEADHCISNSYNHITSVKNFDSLGPDYYLPYTTTCVQTFECFFESKKVPVFFSNLGPYIQMGSDSYVLDENGFYSNKIISIYTDDNLKIENGFLKSVCTKRDNRLSCISNENNDAVVFDEACVQLYNFEYCIKDEHSTVSNAGVGTIQDLTVLNHHMLAFEANTNYNIIVLQKMISAIESILSTMIEHLTKNDPLLLGTILGEQIYSEVEGELYRVYKCIANQDFTEKSEHEFSNITLTKQERIQLWDDKIILFKGTVRSVFEDILEKQAEEGFNEKSSEGMVFSLPQTYFGVSVQTILIYFNTVVSLIYLLRR